MAQPLPASTITKNIIVPMEDPTLRGKHRSKRKQNVHQWNAKKMEGNKLSRPACLGVHVLINDGISTDSFCAIDAKRT